VHRYLTKPWETGALRQTIRQALDRIDELRRQGDAERALSGRERLLAELEQAHPGISHLRREPDGVHVLDAERLERVARNLVHPGLRTLLEG
jgi:hypothetical protein